MSRLRAEVERLKNGGVQRIKDALATTLDTRDAAIARAERAEAALHAMRLVCGTSDADRFTTWLDREIAKRKDAEAERDALAKDKVRQARPKETHEPSRSI
jgi:hypothetical protein